MNFSSNWIDVDVKNCQSVPFNLSHITQLKGIGDLILETVIFKSTSFELTVNFDRSIFLHLSSQWAVRKNASLFRLACVLASMVGGFQHEVQWPRISCDRSLPISFFHSPISSLTTHAHSHTHLTLPVQVIYLIVLQSSAYQLGLVFQRGPLCPWSLKDLCHSWRGALMEYCAHITVTQASDILVLVYTFLEHWTNNTKWQKIWAP